MKFLSRRNETGPYWQYKSRRYQRKFKRARVTKAEKRILTLTVIVTTKEKDTQRPQGTTTADEMDEIKKMFEKIVVDIAEIKENQKTYQQEIQTLTKENQELKERLRRVEKYVKKVEKIERKDNIVIKGEKIQGNETSTEQYVEQLIKEKIGVRQRYKQLE